MYFDSVAAAMDMAGHGGYVWSACFISVLVVAYLLAVPRSRERRVRQQIIGELRRNASAKTAHDNADPASAMRGDL